MFCEKHNLQHFTLVNFFLNRKHLPSLHRWVPKHAEIFLFCWAFGENLSNYDGKDEYVFS